MLTKKQVDKYLSNTRKNGGSRTVEAIYLHFCKGIPVTEAADKLGISRKGVNAAIKPIADKLISEGYERVNLTDYRRVQGTKRGKA